MHAAFGLHGECMEVDGNSRGLRHMCRRRWITHSRRSLTGKPFAVGRSNGHHRLTMGSRKVQVKRTDDDDGDGDVKSHPLLLE